MAGSVSPKKAANVNWSFQDKRYVRRAAKGQFKESDDVVIFRDEDRKRTAK